MHDKSVELEWKRRRRTLMIIGTETLSQIRFSPINGALSQNSLARRTTASKMEQAIAYIRAYPKRFEMFIPIHASRGRRNPPFVVSRCKRNSLKRRSETRQRRVLSPYAVFDAINLPPSPFPSPPPPSLSLSL